jgi:SNF2 family DNA or RNA helicase
MGGLSLDPDSALVASMQGLSINASNAVRKSTECQFCGGLGEEDTYSKTVCCAALYCGECEPEDGQCLCGKEWSTSPNTKPHADVTGRFNKARFSAKTKALVSLLQQVRKADPTAKSIVYSQWTSMLDIIEEVLDAYRIRFVRLDGAVPAARKAEAIERFNDEKEIEVFLISLKAGGVGLNLVVANHVFMMDIWWNPAIEAQAMARVHRIGQRKNVYVHRLIADAPNSFEERVLAKQEAKLRLAEGLLGDSGPSSTSQLRLTFDEIVELLK